MTNGHVTLEILLVDDAPADLAQYVRDFPAVFKEQSVEAHIEPCDTFERAAEMTGNAAYRFDLIISDTYRGPPRHHDAAVMGMIQDYRGRRFCPLVIYSSAGPPPGFNEGPFLKWAQKSRRDDIERAIREVLGTGVPQIARRLRDELDLSAGSYLWGFLEREWHKIGSYGVPALNRLIRRRASVQLGDMEAVNGSPIAVRIGAEYYIYPALQQSYLSLGDVLQHNTVPGDLRVVLTPHCHLFIQPNQTEPRANFVLTVRVVPAVEVLGADKVAALRTEENHKRVKKFALWSRSPAQTGRAPEGRHWYLPEFLEIPHSYCDFLQIESVPYGEVATQYNRLATLVPPYAEALQACFVAFYSSVGIPGLEAGSMNSLVG